jgi:hypothetical protein
MIDETYKEIMREGDLIIYGSGNKRVLMDSKTNQEVTRYKMPSNFQLGLKKNRDYCWIKFSNTFSFCFKGI